MGLENIHAALLLHEAKKDITEDAIAKIVKAAGLEEDKPMIKSTVENLKDVNIEEVLSSAAQTPVAAAPAKAPAEEEKKEEKKESEEGKEKKADEAAAGLSSLFE